MERPLKPFPMPPSAEADDTEDHPPSHNQSAKRLQQSWLKLLVIGVIVVIVIGGALYALHVHTGSKLKHVAISQTIKPSTNQSSSALSQYVSNGQDLNLAFSYPSNWSVTPPSNDNASDQTITVTSPLMTIENAAGSSLTGKVVVSIRPGSDQITELASGNSTAGQASVQIGYTQPVSGQQQYPFLSFINLPGGADSSGNFQEVIITAEQQFSQGDPITSDELSSLDPIVSASFYGCSTQACVGTGQTPLSITINTWQNDDPFSQILALFESLQLH
jgi:hypothetical protein